MKVETLYEYRKSGCISLFSLGQHYYYIHTRTYLPGGYKYTHKGTPIYEITFPVWIKTDRNGRKIEYNPLRGRRIF